MVSEDKKRVLITMSKEVAEQFENLSKEQGLSKSALVTLWVNNSKKGQN